MRKYDQSSKYELEKSMAVVAGYRNNCVRLIGPDGKETGLLTLTYSYDMDLGLQQDFAKRIAAMWNVNR